MPVRFILNEAGMMHGSSNLWKPEKIIEIKEAKPIMTDTVNVMTTTSDEYQLSVTQVQHEVEPLRQELLAKANEEANAIRDQAQAAGAKQGYEAGYAEGKNIGDQIAMQLKAEAQNNLMWTQNEIADYVHTKQDEVLEIAVSIASAMIKKQLSLDKTIIESIAEPMLQKLIEPDILITVTVNPTHHEQMVAVLEQKKAEVKSLRFLILDDMQMELSDIKVETQDTVMQVNLQQELQETLLQLQKVDE